MQTKIMRYGGIALVLAIIMGGLFVLFNQALVTTSGGTSRSVSGLLAKLNKQQLIDASDVVVLATIENVHAFKAPSELWRDQEDIFTDVTLHVDEYLYNPKGIASSTITMRTLGGRVGDEIMSVEHSHEYRAGQQIIVYLYKKDGGVFGSLAPQGVYTIESSGLIGTGDERIFLKDIYGKEQLTMDEFKQEIASLITN